MSILTSCRRNHVQPDRSEAPPGPPGLVMVLGNPNAGKTTLFNALTGLRQHTANYPGVTVEQTVGQMRFGGRAKGGRIDLVDLPGTYSLSASSPDELIVEDALLGRASRSDPAARPPDAILVVADSSNLERNLYLASQAVECGRPVVLALTMADLAERKGLRIDPAALGRELGCRAVAVVAPRGVGLDRLRAAIRKAVAAGAGEDSAGSAGAATPLPEPVESAVGELQHFFAERQGRLRPGQWIHRVEALRVLLDEGGPAEARMLRLFGDELAGLLADLRSRLARSEGIDLATVEPRARYARIEQILKRCVRRDPDQVPARRTRPPADRLDGVLLHPVAGVAVFLLICAVMFQAIYAGAGPLMDAVSRLFDSLGQWAGARLPAGAVRSLLVDGVVAGVGAVLVFLPQVVILFAFIGVLEDCGYMARAAFVMDRLLSRFGLSGRSFVPMLACFACAVPGIMATRVIDDRRERIATILVCPLMSCSARLPVYLLLVGSFIPQHTWLGGWVSLHGLVLLGLYGLGVVAAIPLAWLFRRLLPARHGRDMPGGLLMEVPPFRWPSGRVILVRTADRGRAFLVRAGTIILGVTIVVWALSYFPHPASIEARHDQLEATARRSLTGDQRQAALNRLARERAAEHLGQSFLGRAGRLIEPAVCPLGWDWRVGTAVLASFPARELVVSSLATLHNLSERQGSGIRDEGPGNTEGSSALDTRHSSLDPRPSSFDLPDSPDPKPLTVPAALGLLVFVALSCQCAATLAVIRRETASWPLTALAFGYTTALAYLGALFVRVVSGYWLVAGG